ncbi:MAG TPA: type II toxin-antitoxin system VapC family toxin [Pseudobdellovibrionaceae bacterium]|nr:type II toxin-antitoxin system VapC family toxin [Pseudobdellovibrionaceae bacterium]
MVVDSSVWLEIIGNGPLCSKCEKLLKGEKKQLSALALFEIYRKLKKKISEEAALEATSYLSQFDVIEVNRDIALHAADLSIEHKLSMADSLMLATAHQHNSNLLTLDNDFVGVPGAIVVR